ncbi:MAG: Na+/H+ antiporter subunit E [Actinomycetaceae bacterium]|nr:Na+/H+ antiporter subunit E [Actinomycetaceae bacterium]
MTRVKAALSTRFSWFMTLWLILVWILIFGKITPLVVLSGVLVALAVELIFPLPHTGFFANVRIHHAIVLGIVFVKDMIVAALHVAKVVLTGQKYRCGVVRVDLRNRSELTIAITAAMINLVPGTIVVEMRRVEGTLYLHVFDIDNQGGVEGVRAASLAQEARVLKAIAPREALGQLENEEAEKTGNKPKPDATGNPETTASTEPKPSDASPDSNTEEAQ